MAARFGSAYQAYRASVPRWLQAAPFIHHVKGNP